MLDPKELRIGNWVLFGDGEMFPFTEVQVGSLNADLPGYLGEGINSGSPGIYRGISLTPEILTEWCGFIEKHQPTFSGGYDYFMKFFEQADTKGTYSTRKFTISDKTGYVFLNDHFIGRCDYLHQLQNFVHTLFEIELEIKLPQS